MQIKVNTFGGEAPKTSDRLLDVNMATLARNAKLWSGEIRPFMLPLEVFRPLLDGVIKTIFKYDGGTYTRWFTWEDEVDAVLGTVADDTNFRIYFTGDGVPKKTNSTLALSGGDVGPYPEASYPLGVPAPSAALTATLQTSTGTATQDVVWTYTYVTNWGEEGPPAAVSNSLTILAGDTIRLTGFAAAPGTHPNITKIRIYRSSADTEGGIYLFVDEIDIDPLPTQYDDNNVNEALGEEMPSLYWDGPPDDMFGLISLPGGIMAGISGKKVCFSEPYYPHAWPEAYQYELPWNPVSLGCFGTTVVVGTEAYPYTLDGTHPESMRQDRIPALQPCLSARGMSSSEYGVTFASPDGLFLVGPDGYELTTRDAFSRDEWSQLYPSALQTEIVDNKLFGFFQSGVSGDTPTGEGFVLDLQDTLSRFSRIDFYAPAMHVVPSEGALYVCVQEEATGENVIQKWDSNAQHMTATWISKVLALPPMNWAAARVDANFDVELSEAERDALNATRDLIIARNAAKIAANTVNGAPGEHDVASVLLAGDELEDVPSETDVVAVVYFRWYVDDELVVSRRVTDSEPFRLPSGMRGREFQFAIISTVNIEQVTIGTSVSACAELAASTEE